MSCRNAEQERIAGALHSVELALAGTSIYKSSSKLLDGHSFTPRHALGIDLSLLKLRCSPTAWLQRSKQTGCHIFFDAHGF